MAVTPNTNDTFLREVDEELRRDQAIAIWRKWGRLIVAGIIAALIAFGGYLYWQHRTAQAAGAEGETLQAAYDKLAANQPNDAAKPLAELAQSKSDGYRALAVFTQADLLLQKDDLKGAAAKFASIATDQSVAQPFRDLALVRQTTAEFDALKPEVIIARLRGLAVQGNPWFGSAGELVAAAYLRQGRRDLAGATFGRIAKDETVPETIRQRAVQMAGTMGIDAVGANEGANKQ